MAAEDQVERYLAALPQSRQADMRRLHGAILKLNPGCRVWFVDGKDEHGKVVSNPSIGYGAFDRTYADGSTRELYQVGISANATGLSVYLMGMDDRTYLKRTYADSIGKASITGYCIKLKSLEQVNLQTLEAAIRDGFERARS